MLPQFFDVKKQQQWFSIFSFQVGNIIMQMLCTPSCFDILLITNKSGYPFSSCAKNWKLSIYTNSNFDNFKMHNIGPVDTWPLKDNLKTCKFFVKHSYTNIATLDCHIWNCLSRPYKGAFRRVLCFNSQLWFQQQSCNKAVSILQTTLQLGSNYKLSLLL